MQWSDEAIYKPMDCFASLAMTPMYEYIKQMINDVSDM